MPCGCLRTGLLVELLGHVAIGRSEGAHGLEWTVPSPAPHHTFNEPPVVQ